MNLIQRISGESRYGRKISNLYGFLNRSTRRWESIRAKRQCDNYWIFFFAIFSKFRKFSNKYNVRNDSKFFFPRLYAYSYFLKHNFITISIAIFVFPVFSTNINTRENVLSFLFIARAYIEKKKITRVWLFSNNEKSLPDALKVILTLIIFQFN